MAKAKSFYIFDFDDNMIFTGSKTFIFHRETGESLGLGSREFALAREQIGHTGPYKDFEIDPSPMRSFRSYADDEASGHYPFLDDLKRAVERQGWQGPSWQRFVKAVTRERTIAIITARGHHPSRIEEGLHWMASQGLLPREPDIMKIYTVTHPSTREELRWTGDDWIASLKKLALNHFIELTYDKYGYEPKHRFGFSDDDPRNIASTREKFLELKRRNPHHSFFLFEARPKEVHEEEILLPQVETH